MRKNRHPPQLLATPPRTPRFPRRIKSAVASVGAMARSARTECDRVLAWVCCYRTVNTRTLNGGVSAASASVAADTPPAAAISRIESDIKGTLGDMGGRQNRHSPRLLATPSRTLRFPRRIKANDGDGLHPIFN